ncbi:TPA: hypothetical protein QFF30_002450, partial [Enterococcus faecium]
FEYDSLTLNLQGLKNAIRKADKSALTYEKIGNLTLNEQRSAQWGKFIFFSLGQDLGARH